MTSASSLVENLRSADIHVSDAGMVTQPFFGVPAHVFTVDGGDLQTYEFATIAEADRAAGQVAPGGGSVGTAMMSWMAPPHFFRKDRLIVNYVGGEARVIAELTRLMGPQFAGAT